MKHTDPWEDALGSSDRTRCWELCRRFLRDLFLGFVPALLRLRISLGIALLPAKAERGHACDTSQISRQTFLHFEDRASLGERMTVLSELRGIRRHLGCRACLALKCFFNISKNNRCLLTSWLGEREARTLSESCLSFCGARRRPTPVGRAEEAYGRCVCRCCRRRKRKEASWLIRCSWSERR